jgi:hypothetical protein
MLNTTGEDLSDYYNVIGALIYDPILGDRAVSTNAPVADFVYSNANLWVTDAYIVKLRLTVCQLSFRRCHPRAAARSLRELRLRRHDEAGHQLPAEWYHNHS